MCIILFVGTGFYYLNKNFETANQVTEKVPYKQNLCDNKGVLFAINNKEIFVYLDFLESKIIISLNPEKSDEGKIYGYSHEYTVTGNDDLVVALIDNIGGIELDADGEKLRYTGVQVCELLKRSDSLELRRNIITEVCKKIERFGVDSSFVVHIINNSENNINLGDCYFWDENLAEVCSNLHFID